MQVGSAILFFLFRLFLLPSIGPLIRQNVRPCLSQALQGVPAHYGLGHAFIRTNVWPWQRGNRLSIQRFTSPSCQGQPCPDAYGLGHAFIQRTPGRHSADVSLQILSSSPGCHAQACLGANGDLSDYGSHLFQFHGGSRPNGRYR